ncbi:MAG TPA: ArsA family ATPase, partial [Myxococcales bacterium]|nr:ArsA family ATPase [Myxococcales bacterium]
MLRFYAGKGGAGKTTCAAAAALALAREGARTLVVSTDPAHSLGDALGLRLAASPRAVRGRLFAAELDADRALRRWLSARERSLRLIASRGTYLDDDDVDALFRLSLPGVDELVALIELRRLSGGFEEVVVDTAPTGHTLRLLEMPETLARLAGVLDDLQSKHRALALSLRGAVRRDAEEQLIEQLRDEARELHALLRSDDVEFHWVTLAEELSAREARDGILTLRAAGLSVVRLVVNRLTPTPDQSCPLCIARRAEEARVLGGLRDLGLPLRAVDEQDHEPRGLAALAKVARALGRPEDWRQGAAAARIRRAPPARAPENGAQLPAHLAPEGLRLLFFGGKGGVGKTTAAATAALSLARQGGRVLLLSTDPAHSAGDALDVSLDDEEREVAPGLRARELDAARAFQ